MSSLAEVGERAQFSKAFSIYIFPQLPDPFTTFAAMPSYNFSVNDYRIWH